MSNRARSGSIPTELPPCDGPKLQLFEYHESPIEWLERLDTNRDTDAATEGYVFRARIRGRLYAIKVVRRCLCFGCHGIIIDAILVQIL